MWVVKIGGSLLGTPELASWLNCISKLGDGNVIIVPGGGVFAEAVRKAQSLSHMSDACAHVLAVNAMNQFAEYLIDTDNNLVKARNELEIAERSWQHRGIVWMPSEMVLAQTDIPQSWDVTSDSLAAWLATKISAKHLLIIKSSLLHSAVKSAPLRPVQASLLVDSGVVDKALPDFIGGAVFDTWLLNKEDFHHFANGFDEALLPKVAVRVSDH